MITPYISLLSELKATVRTARLHAIRQVNRSLTLMYFEMGRQIVQSQKEHEWGNSIVEQLSVDLREAFPAEKGFSPRSLWRMRKFYLIYKDDEILSQLVAEIPWGHNLVLISDSFSIEQRTFYLRRSAQHGWTRAVLTHQISAKLYERTKLEPRANNFKETLPENLIDQANEAIEAIKSSYNLEFLGIEEEVREQELEDR